MPRHPIHMHIELMALYFRLTRWVKTPEAAICMISAFDSDKRRRPYSPEEIRHMRMFFNKNNWISYMELFYGEGPEHGPWPMKFSRESMNRLGTRAKRSIFLNYCRGQITTSRPG